MPKSKLDAQTKAQRARARELQAQMDRLAQAKVAIGLDLQAKRFSDRYLSRIGQSVTVNTSERARVTAQLEDAHVTQGFKQFLVLLIIYKGRAYVSVYARFGSEWEFWDISKPHTELRAARAEFKVLVKALSGSQQEVTRKIVRAQEANQISARWVTAIKGARE